MLLALAVALPFVMLTSGIMWQLANNERETRREAILFSTRTLMNAVDTVLNKQIAVGQMLASSPALDAGDFAALRTSSSPLMYRLLDMLGQQLARDLRRISRARSRRESQLADEREAA